MEYQYKHQVAHSTFSIWCKLLWKIPFYNLKPFTYKAVFSVSTSRKKYINKVIKKVLITYEMLIQN